MSMVIPKGNATPIFAPRAPTSANLAPVARVSTALNAPIIGRVNGPSASCGSCGRK
jgi:hypothetical protein